MSGHMQQAVLLFDFCVDGSKMPTDHQANAIALAQVQATLALAYATDTANLIAVERLQVSLSESQSATSIQVPAAIWERL